MRAFTLCLIFSFLLIPESHGKNRKKRKAKPRPIKPRWTAVVSTGIPHPVDVGIGLIQPKGNSQILTLGTYQLNLGSRGRVKNMRANINHLEYKYRMEPLRGHSIFWEAALGYQEINIAGTQTIDLESDGAKISVPTSARIDIRSLYTAVHGGMVFYRKQGFYTGFSFGYQIPFYSWADVDSSITGDEIIDAALKSTAAYQELEGELETLGRRAGKFGLPYIQILELGYHF